MKKLLLCGVAVLSFGLAERAQAQDYSSVVFKPYVGIDLQRFSVDYKDGGNQFFEEDLNGLNIHAGARWGKYFGLEAGVFKTREESKSVDGNTIVAGFPDFSTDVDLWGVTLDGMGYLPVHQNFELIGTAGVSWINAESSTDIAGANMDVDESEIGFRIGGGAQFNVTEDWNIRGLARYQTADFDKAADHAVVYTLGVNLSF